MTTAFARRGRPGFALAALCVCFLPAHALADELQYLTDNPQMILSVDMAAARKTRTFEELMKPLKKEVGGPNRDPFFAKVIESDFRLTWSFAQSDRQAFAPTVLVITAPKNLTIAEVKAWLAPVVKQKPEDLKFKETKYGSVTIYHEALIPFFIDGKYLVAAFPASEDGMKGEESMLGTLKKIIDRKKTADLSPVMKAGLKVADLSNTISMVLDFKGFDARTQKELAGMFFQGLPNFADIKDNAGKVQGITLTANERGKKTTVAATLLCADKAGAARIEEIAGKSKATLKVMLADFTQKVKDMPNLFPGPKAMKVLEAAATALSALELSTKGSNVVARVELDPVTVGMASWAVVPQIEASKVDFAKAQCRALKTAVQAYMLRNKDQAPKSLADLKKGDSPYLEKDAVLTDPWGNPYQLEVLDDGQVVVFSKGPPGGPRIPPEVKKK